MGCCLLGNALTMTLEQAVIISVGMMDEISYAEAERFWHTIQEMKDLPHEGDCLKQPAPCRPCAYRRLLEDGDRLLNLLRDSQGPHI